jgi:hypothetical protein
VVVIPEQKQTEDINRFVCPNVFCRKSFNNPLKAVNFGVSMKPYDACPYCLTEIRHDSEPVQLEEQQEARFEEKCQTQAADRSPNCKNFFGFLGERPAQTDIPDECLTCKGIVNCMLSKSSVKE